MMENRIPNSYCFDDVLLVPKYSDIQSRKEVDLSTSVPRLHTTIGLPIVSSPMDTVTEDGMAAAMASLGGLGIIHRYNSIEEQCGLVESAYRISPLSVIGAAVGVTGDYEERAVSLYDSGASVICVDIAHGHHMLMRTALENLRKRLGDKAHIMAGNVATLEGFNALSDWGADSIRVGIGGGSICSTRIQTGHGMPTLYSIMQCSKSDRDSLLVADGGIRTSGDIVKCLAAGADIVMLGSMLAGTDESPGDIIHIPKTGEAVKSYRGMASVEAQIDWRGHTSSVEGVSTTVGYKGSVKDIIMSLDNGIRSGLSYSGCRSVSELQASAQFIRQSSLGATESSTHILNK